MEDVEEKLHRMMSFDGTEYWDVIVGYSCNNNCIFCGDSNKRNAGDRSTEAIKEELRKVKEEGINQVNFLGGEPTIRKDIFELVSYAKGLGFERILVISNGRMFAYEDFTRRIIEAGANRVLFSIQSVKGEINDELIRSEDCFGQLVKGMENVRKFENVAIETNTVVTKLNYKTIPELAEWLAKRVTKTGHSLFTFVYPDGNALRYFERVVPRISDVVPYVKKGIDIMAKHGLNVFFYGIPLCQMSGYENYSGDLSRSLKVLETKLGSGWVKGRECGVCRFKYVCIGLSVPYAERIGFEELSCIKGKKIKTLEEFRKGFSK